MLRSSDRRFLYVALGMAAFGGPTFVLMNTADADGKPSRLVAEVGGLRNDKGTIFCALFNSEEGFPTLESKAFRLAQAKPQSKHAACDFGTVPAGAYAVSVIHDENDNKKLDTNFFGARTEGYGASNDARGSFGPPKFKDAKFEYKGGPLTLKITVHY